MSADDAPPAAPTLSDARTLDASDVLAPLRERFALPHGVLYFDGNSLGALPTTVPARIAQVVEDDWGTGLIRSWFERGWWEAPLRVGDLIAPIIGCAEGQVVVGDSVSVHVFNLLAAAIRLKPGRQKVLLDAEVFPTDRYMAASVARLLGASLHEVTMTELHRELAAHGEQVAAVLASAVDYRSGELSDIAEVTGRCHEHGALAIWDLCHAAGAIELRLDDDEVDLAVGCTYKYLSGGPGAPAFAYVARRHQDAIDPPLTGWHGHERPFDFAPRYVPAKGIARARIGTPHLLSMLALEEALSVFREAPIPLIRSKSVALGEFFMACVDAMPAELGIECITPRDELRRGSHVALTHPRGADVMAELVQRGVICDLRPPNVLRFGFNALYISFQDVFNAVSSVAEAVGALGHEIPDHASAA